jgi:hypothetical protein
MNPDPTTRFIAFRLIASILDLSPPMLHFELLRELIEECPFPQMKAAAVGLLKDAVLAALRSDVCFLFNEISIGTQLSRQR